MQKLPKVGVGTVIFNDQNEILLIKRKKKPEANHWSIPGGKVDWFETLEEAVIREIKEETGLDIQVKELLCVTDHILQEENVHYVAPTYLSEVTGGQIEKGIDDAILDIGWFSLKSLPKPLTLTTQNALKHLRIEGVLE